MYYTHQEIAQRIVDHLFAQKNRSRLEESKVCAYRGSNGLMCAVGCLIKDEFYRPEIEGIASGLIAPRASDTDGITRYRMLMGVLDDSGIPTGENTLALLQQFQDFHDVMYSAKDFQTAWRLELLINNLEQLAVRTNITLDLTDWMQLLVQLQAEEAEQ